MYCNEYTPVCDNCDAELDSEDCYEDALFSVRCAGWEFEYVKGNVECFCPECYLKLFPE